LCENASVQPLGPSYAYCEDNVVVASAAAAAADDDDDASACMVEAAVTGWCFRPMQLCHLSIDYASLQNAQEFLLWNDQLVLMIKMCGITHDLCPLLFRNCHAFLGLPLERHVGPTLRTTRIP